MNKEVTGKSYVVAIADSRWKYILYSLICWALVIAGFATIGAKERHWQFWMAEVIMFAFGSGLLYMLLSPKYLFIGRNGAAYDTWMQEKHNELVNQDGIFIYTNVGFIFPGDTEPLEINWSDIQKVIARVEDELSNDDDLVVRIELPNSKFIEFDEEIAGWTKWEEEFRRQFPSVNANWMQEVLISSQKEAVLFAKR